MEETGNRFKPISMSYVLLLSQYYRWIKEGGSMDSFDELRHSVLEKAEYQVQASDIKYVSSSVGNA